MLEVTEKEIKNKRGNRYLLCDVCCMCVCVCFMCVSYVFCALCIFMCYMCTLHVYCMLCLSVVQCVCLVNELYVSYALYMCCV